MTAQTHPRRRLAGTLCGLVFVEWILFELLRAPYRPPQDMTTFLGTEKYAVMAFMLILALAGIALILFWAARSIWTKRDRIVFAFLVPALIGLLALVIFAPWWPVTPFHLLLR
jgi:hypothetical protein